jgi:nicotinamide riboside kinase
MTRIAFVGSHSTGKTTLLRYCQEQFEGGLHTIEDLSRRIIARGFPIGPYAVVDSFVNFVRDQLYAERESHAVEKAWLISNRTVLDAVAYACANKDLPRPFIPDYFIEMLEEVARLEATSYDLYVEFPVLFPMTPDGIRPEGEDYRMHVGTEISRLLNAFGVPQISVAGTTAERFRSLVEHVQGLGKRPRNARA